MQTDQAKIPPATTLLQDQEPVKDVLPLSTPVASTIRSDEKTPPASEFLQPPYWNPITFGDEDEEDEEIPSINMDSDSDQEDRTTRKNSYIPSDPACVCLIYIDYIYYSPLNCGGRLALNASKASSLSLS